MLERIIQEPLARETGQPLLALTSFNNLIRFDLLYVSYNNTITAYNNTTRTRTWARAKSISSLLCVKPSPLSMISSLLDWASGTSVSWAERYCSLRRQRLKYEYIYCCCEPLVHFRSTRLINSSHIDPDKTLKFEKKSDWNWSLYFLVFYLC